MIECPEFCVIILSLLSASFYGWIAPFNAHDFAPPVYCGSLPVVQRFFLAAQRNGIAGSRVTKFADLSEM